MTPQLCTVIKFVELVVGMVRQELSKQDPATHRKLALVFNYITSPNGTRKITKEQLRIDLSRFGIYFKDPELNVCYYSKLGINKLF